MSPRHSSTVTVSQVQLPIWPEEMRGLPNSFARSALFCVANCRAGERANLKRQQIAAVNGVTITYTGEQLRQDDEDVFLQILHIARHHELGTEVRFTAYAMISELGWTKNSQSYRRLIDCLDRLKASSLSVTVELPNGSRKNYTGSLVRSFRWREEANQAPMREWEILLEKEIISLYGPTDYSRLEWRTRLQLPPLAKWLHSFYHTHREPIPLPVTKIHEWTGSEIKEVRKFRYKLKQALELLVERGFFISANIDPRTDYVHVERNPRRPSGMVTV